MSALPPTSPHPVAELLVRAWRGPREPVDGSWRRVPTWREGVHAVVSVTGRALVTAPDDVTDAELAALGVDGWGHAHDPRVMTRLAGAGGWVDVLDAVLLAEGTGDPSNACVRLLQLRTYCLQLLAAVQHARRRAHHRQRGHSAEARRTSARTSRRG